MNPEPAVSEKPARESIAAVALIGHKQDGQTVWLARWNQKWNAYHLVAGHKLADESFRECMLRELGEELGLRENADFSLGQSPRAHVEFVAWSDSHQVQTTYIMELFDVRLTEEAVRGMIDRDPDNRWLSEAEIRAGRCNDDSRVSDTMVRLLSHVGWEVAS